MRGRRGSKLLERKRALRANHRAHESPFYAPLGHIRVRGGLNLSSPSTSAKVNRLVIRYLHFWSVRGDLQEGHDYGKRLGGYDKLLHDYASRWQFLSSLCQFLPSRSLPLVLPSTKSRFLCAFCLRDPHFRAFQAQKSTFCTILPSRTPDFRLFEHKIEVFVRFWPSEPPFSGFPSTKLAFLCS